MSKHMSNETLNAISKNLENAKGELELKEAAYAAGTATGSIIGVKAATSELRKELIDNLARYYNEPVDIKKVQRLRAAAVAFFTIPFILLFIFTTYMQQSTAMSTQNGKILAISTIILFFGLFIVGIKFAQYVNKKYIHHMYIHDPEKEKHYRWSYLIIFTDEIEEYNEYIKKHPLSRPSGIVKPVYIDRQTMRPVDV